MTMQPILTVDLSSGSTGMYRVPPAWERDYLGGASLAARLLYDRLTRDLDPFSPDAPLLFLNGPLSGTAGPAVGRFVVCGKGPATGLWAESNCGGFWGPELRSAGFDGLWLTGCAPQPVYLWIHDGEAELRPAGHLWGLDTYQVQAAIKAEVGAAGVHVAGIGPAGENRVRFAGIFCDHGRTAGRTGLGAVMGSKNLKAVAVKGSGPVPVADAGRYAPVRSAANRLLKSDNIAEVLHSLGTSGVADYAEYIGSLPRKNFRQGAGLDVNRFSGATMSETILAGTSACHACVIACGRVVRLDGEKRKGPEYESIVGLGPNLLIEDLPTITRLMELADRYGMDTISLGGTIGLAMHLFEQGRLTVAETGGLELRWGDASVVERLIHLTARREGIGDLLAEGSRRFGRHFGAEDEAVQVNGLEVAYHDPRSVSGMALVYATSPRGACHNQSDYFFVDWGQAEASLKLEIFDRQGGAEKAANVARHQDWRTLCNALVLCLFSNVPIEMVTDLVNAACGTEFIPDDLMRAGERAWNLKRAINHRLGLTRASDRLPKALLEPLPDGNAAGYVPPIQEMLAAYYQARGWDPETGRPTRDTLTRLGLADVAVDLWG